MNKNLPLIPIEPLPEDIFEQNRALLARNGELKAENEQLKRKNEALSDGYEQMSQLANERSFDVEKQNERLNELEAGLAQAKILIADWAIKLKYYGEL